MKPDLNGYEVKRLAAVDAQGILDTAPESDFDDLVKLAAMIFHVPISTVTIVDAHRQWFKAAVGLIIKETPRNISFCTDVVDNNAALIVENAHKDPRFSHNPLVLNEPHIDFYAGVPLCTSDNLAIGTFCIMDEIPRKFTIHELETLKVLANQAMKLLELRMGRKKLAESEQRWKFALEGAGDGVWDWNIKTQQVIFNRQWKEMLGYTEDDPINDFVAWHSLVHPEDLETVLEKLNAYLDKKTDTYQAEFRMKCKNQSWKWILSRGTAMSFDIDGSPLRMVGTHTDISQRKLSEETIWKQANFDALTGLPNRRMFFDRLNEEIKRSARSSQDFSLMFIDLDGFKEVNDELGHQAGDQLLIDASLRISNCLRESDTVARLGGDEFTVIISNILNLYDAENIAEKILKTLNEPFILDSNNIQISASMGIAIYPQDGEVADTLINNADKAMYEAKNKGKNCWSISNV